MLVFKAKETFKSQNVHSPKIHLAHACSVERRHAECHHHGRHYTKGRYAEWR